MDIFIIWLNSKCFAGYMATRCKNVGEMVVSVSFVAFSYENKTNKRLKERINLKIDIQ